MKAIVLQDVFCENEKMPWQEILLVLIKERYVIATNANKCGTLRNLSLFKLNDWDIIPLQQSRHGAGDPSLFFFWSKYQRGSCGPDEWRGLERDGAGLGYRKPVHTAFLNQSANRDSWEQLSSKWSCHSFPMPTGNSSKNLCQVCWPWGAARQKHLKIIWRQNIFCTVLALSKEK